MLLAVVLVGPVGLVWCLQAIRRGQPDAWPLLVGISGLMLVYAILIVIGVGFAEDFGPELQRLLVPPDWYGWLMLHVCMIVMLAAGYQRSQQRSRTATQRVLLAQEEERKRVARELHGGVGQSLTAVKMELDLLSTRAEAGESLSRQAIETVTEQTEQMIDELHRVANDLRPATIETLGLVEAVRAMARTIELQSQLEIRVTADELRDADLSTPHVYRVVQEALHNIVRHARATEVDIVMRVKRKRFLLEIRDNGDGFDLKDFTNGLGLPSMRERAELLGGHFQISAKRGQGTWVRLELPLDSSA